MLRFDQLDKELRHAIRRDYLTEGIRSKEFKECVAALVEFYEEPMNSVRVPGRLIIGRVIKANPDKTHDIFVMDPDKTYGFVGPE